MLLDNELICLSDLLIVYIDGAMARLGKALISIVVLYTR